MPSKRMLPHTVTIFNYIGESIDGKAQYLPTVIHNVYARMAQGIVVGRVDSGVTLAPQDELIVYIFDQNSKAASLDGNAKTFLSFGEWYGSQAKPDHWTVHDDGSDLLVIGTPAPTRTGAPPSSAQVFRAVKSVRRQGGRPRMWHWEVHCA